MSPSLRRGGFQNFLAQSKQQGQQGTSAQGIFQSNAASNQGVRKDNLSPFTSSGGFAGLGMGNTGQQTNTNPIFGGNHSIVQGPFSQTSKDGPFKTNPNQTQGNPLLLNGSVQKSNPLFPSTNSSVQPAAFPFAQPQTQQNNFGQGMFDPNRAGGVFGGQMGQNTGNRMFNTQNPNMNATMNAYTEQYIQKIDNDFQFQQQQQQQQPGWNNNIQQRPVHPA